MSAGDDDLFARWSRRKQAVRRVEEEEGAGAADAERQLPEPPASEPAEPPPSLDDLTAEGDLSAFLREGVPAALRKAAMRKMWSLDPAIRDHVGLSENAWDFNQPDAMAGFGPLEAGKAVAGFLSTVSRAMAADPEGTSTVPEAPAPEPPASLPPDETAEAAETPEDPPPSAAASAAESEEAEGSGDSSRPPPGPRHGGALPR
jgi:hypothetical protein